MKVHIHINHTQFKFDETITGATADDIVGSAKSKIAAKAPFALRIVVNSMSNAAFMTEIIKRYNAEIKPPTPAPLPSNAVEFLQTAEKLGVATILEK